MPPRPRKQHPTPSQLEVSGSGQGGYENPLAFWALGQVLPGCGLEGFGSGFTIRPEQEQTLSSSLRYSPSDASLPSSWGVCWERRGPSSPSKGASQQPQLLHCLAGKDLPARCTRDPWSRAVLEEESEPHGRGSKQPCKYSSIAPALPALGAQIFTQPSSLQPGSLQGMHGRHWLCTPPGSSLSALWHCSSIACNLHLPPVCY